MTALAVRQQNAFSRAQAYECGADRQLVWRRSAAGAWRPAGAAGPDVFTIPGVADAWLQGLWVAHLACGPESMVSFESAGQAHRLEGVIRGRVVLTVEHSDHHLLDGAFVHQLTDVLPDHVTAWNGLPITTVVRTIIDLAAVLGPVRLRSVIESAITARLTTFTAIDGLRREVTRRGKPGMRKLVTVLDAMDGEPPPASVLEQWLHDAAHVARVPIVRQAPLPWTREPIVGVVDAVTEEVKVIWETDGRSWHARYRDMARDRRRDREAAKAGYLTVRFVHADLKNDLSGSAQDMRDIYDNRAGLLPASRR